MPTPVANPTNSTHPPHQTIAGCFALSAFAISIVAGLYAGNSTDVILGRAMLCLLVCYGIGTVLGRLCTHAVSEYLNEQTGSTELPDLNVSVDDLVAEMARDQSPADETTPAQTEESEEDRQE